MGARPLRRAIQRLIEDPLADFILGRELDARLDDLVDRRENPVERRAAGRDHASSRAPPVPATVGGPDEAPDADEPADEPVGDA